MKTLSIIIQRIQKILQSNKYVSLGFFLIGVAVIYLLILLKASIFATSIPLLGVGLSWIWFLLPGLLFSYYVVPKSMFWERVSIGFVLTIGLLTPLTVVAILLRVSLNTFIYLHVASLVISAIVLIILTIFKNPDEFPKHSSQSLEQSINDRSFALLLLLLIILVGALAFFSYQWPITGDDTAILPLFGDVLNQNQISGTEPFHGSGVSVTPRNELIVATYLEILVNKISGLLPQEFIVNSRPILIIMAMLSLATFLLRFTKDKRLSLFLLNLWSIYLLITIQTDNTGSDFITRIFQDKYLGWFVIVPIALIFMLGFIINRDWKNLNGFFIVTLGASMVHPITLIQVMILGGGFGLTHFVVKRTKGLFINLVLIAIVILICTIIPFVQYLRFSNFMPIDLVGLSDAVEFGRLSAAINRYRLWLLEGGRFILHPSIILKPIIIAAYALLPVVILKLRKKDFAQFIIGVMILLPILLYVPFFTKLVGKVVTPFLIWRLAWPFPMMAIIAIGSVLSLIVNKFEEMINLKNFRLSLSGYLYSGFIILIFLTAIPSIKKGLLDYKDRRLEVTISTCIIANNVFAHLAELTKENPANVLSSHDLNLCIPGYSPNANVVEFRGYGTINRLSYENIDESIQRVEDVYYFNTARLVDKNLMNSIEKYNIDYILIEKDKVELNLQFDYISNYFTSVYEDSNFELYLVKNENHPTAVIDGNIALRLKQYDLAKDIFFKILENDPQNVLALLGVGLAEEGLGNSKQAIAYYQQSISFAPDEPALHSQLASAYMLVREFEKSASEYKIAIDLSPERSNLYKDLGEIYLLLGQLDDALSSFEKYASLRGITGTARYYSFLGRSLQNIELLTEEAILFQEKAISIQPDSKRYIDLARTYILRNEYDKAIAELESAIKWDRWNYLPHLELGYIYFNKGEIDQAIKELEIACQLNPANVSSYILLGLAIQEKDGIDSSLSRLEELMQVNRVLPGPYRSYAVMMASSGKFDESMKALDHSKTLQPRSPAILTSKGYISMLNGQMDSAYEAFDQALQSYPDLVSALLGLGRYYNIESNYQLETGNMQEIAQIMPATTWIRMLLADMYKQQGDYSSALDETNWAIKIDPDNPDIYILRGDINRMQSNWSVATSDYEIALKLDPQNFTALTRLGEIYQSLSNYQEAEKMYKLASQNQPDSTYPIMQLADLFWQLGRVQEASILEDLLKEMDPESDLVLIRTANNYQKQGQIEEARAIFNQVIEKTPDNISAYLSLAQLFEEDNDIGMLVTIYNDVLGISSGSAKAYLSVGKFLISQAQFDLANQMLSNGLISSDVSIDNYFVYSELLQRLGKNNEALKTLETAVKIFPGDGKAFEKLAYHHLNAGDIQIAENYFNRAIELNQDLVSSYSGLSQIEQIRGNSVKAEEILQSAVVKNPGLVDAILALATLQESLSKTEASETNIKKALDINPSNINTRLSAGVFYYRQGRYSEASEQLTTALDLPGSKIEIYIQLGNLELTRLKIEEAIEWYEIAKLEDQSDVRPYIALSKAYQAMGNYRMAFETLSTALKNEPANVEIILALGRLSSISGDFSDSRAYFENAIIMDQSNISSRIELAELLKNQKDWNKVINLLDQVIKKNPINLSAYSSLAHTYQLMNDCFMAESVIISGIPQVIEKQNGYLAAARVYEMCGDWNTAQEYYELAWSNEPESIKAGLELVNFYLGRNEKEQALSTLKLLENQIGTNSAIFSTYGSIYTSQAKWNDAVESYKNAILLDPNQLDGYIGLANVYEMQGNLEGAIALYETASEKIINPEVVYLKLGMLLKNQGKLQDAKFVFEKTLELEPFNVVANTNILQLNIVLDQPEKDILEFVNEAIQSPSSSAFTTIAQLYQLKGESRQAYSWLQKAIHLDPLNSDTLYYLGNYYQWSGQWQKALEAYTQSLEYEPNSVQILVATGEVQQKLSFFDEAEKSFLRAINIRPGDASGYIALAKLQMFLGNYEEAINTIKLGTDQSPADYRYYATLGDIYLNLETDNTKKAEEVYQAGLMVFPGSTELYIKLGDLHSNQVTASWEKLEVAKNYKNLVEIQYLDLLTQIGPNTDINLQPRFIREKYEKLSEAFERGKNELLVAQMKYNQTADNFTAAEKYYMSALALNNNNALALQGLGRLQVAKGFVPEGLSYFEKASDLNPFSSTAFISLGNLFDEIGQSDKAINILELVLDREPMNFSAQLALTNAYRNQSSLTTSQATKFVELSISKMETLIAGIRQHQFAP